MKSASAALVSKSGIPAEVTPGITVTVTWPVDVRTTTDLVSISGILAEGMLLGVMVTITWPVEVMTTTDVESETPVSLSVTVVASSFGMSTVAVTTCVTVTVVSNVPTLGLPVAVLPVNMVPMTVVPGTMDPSTTMVVVLAVLVRWMVRVVPGVASTSSLV